MKRTGNNYFNKTAENSTFQAMQIKNKNRHFNIPVHVY